MFVISCPYEHYVIMLVYPRYINVKSKLFKAQLTFSKPISESKKVGPDLV